MRIKIHTFLIILALFLSPLSFSNRAIAYDGDVYVPILDGSPFFCLVNEEYGNGLAWVLEDYEEEVSLPDKIQSLLRKIRKLKVRIVEARESGQVSLLYKLKANRAWARNLRNAMISCLYQETIYDPNYIPPPDLPTAPSNPGTDPGTDPEPVTETPCSVIGNKSTLAISSNRQYQRIVNGTVCQVGNSPVVELELYVNGNIDSYCTGTVVNSRTVITAAHCAVGVTSMRIYYGTGNISTNLIYVHPNYPYGNLEDHDIAVVRTNVDIPTRYINILGTNNFTSSELVVIGGYGLTSGSNPNSYGRLRAANALLASFIGNSIGTVYTGGIYGNTCQGDSGGPLLVKRGNEWVLAGVTSNGTNDTCSATDYSYYANLTSSINRNFINSIVPGLIN